MRARNIKPGFFKSEGIASCSFQARLLFVGLWCMADREGRLEDRPQRIKAELFPYDNVNVDKLLDEIASKTDCDGTPSFIIRYGHPKKYIQILHFLSHQRPHLKENESQIPAFDGVNSTSTNLGENKHLPCTERERLNPHSLILNPDIPIYAFADFYSKYPKKKARPEAERAWKKIDPKEHQAIMDGLERAKQSQDWAKDGGKYIPFPATFLNGRRWEDEYSVEIATVPIMSKSQQSLVEYIRQQEEIERGKV